jgi:hypothetical protein
MKRSAILVALFSIMLTGVLPFVGGSGPSLFSSSDPAHAGATTMPIFATQSVPVEGTSADEADAELSNESSAAREIRLTSDSEHLAQAPVAVAPATAEVSDRAVALANVGLACPGNLVGVTAAVAGRTAGNGAIAGTTTADLKSFAGQFNAVRVANCLQPVPVENFRYDACMEDRLIWMAEDPSDDPLSAWGHTGSVRSDGVASVGCDGNLAGGGGDTGATVAVKWWDSLAHRDSLYKPSYAGATSGVCIYLAMTHGGIGQTIDEPAVFARAAARWGGC